MENGNTKRYLITYTDEKISSAGAMSLLSVPKEILKDGVAFMQTTDIAGKEYALHFENLGITSVELTPAEAGALLAKDEILAVEEDVEMYIQGFISEPKPGAESATAADDDPRWNMNLVTAPQAWANGYDGTGINVAILDTGIAAHPDLVISGGAFFVPGVVSYNDGNGHGTHCAGVVGGRLGLDRVWGVARACNLYAVKVMGDDGKGNSGWTIAGMSWCIDNNIDVISMSIGGKNAPFIAYGTAIKRCQDAGVVVVCSSGNTFVDPDPPIFPWVNSPGNSFLQTIKGQSPVAVGAINNMSVIANFSSRGGQTADWNLVTVVAPGVDIYSTFLNNGYQTMSGTSMACPHVAGMAALLMQRYPGISPQLVFAKMAATANNLGASPYPNAPYGYGLIDCNAATL